MKMQLLQICCKSFIVTARLVVKLASALARNMDYSVQLHVDSAKAPVVPNPELNLDDED